MTREQFIKKIAPLVRKHAPSYGIKVCSPVIAQAVLESGGDTSELAVNANNFFGLKYREGRCPTCSDVYYKDGSEQNADGSYTTSAMKWCKFDSMEDGVKGYFDFINVSNYANLKGVADPQEYLENIKADGYATSLNYVSNVMAIIRSYGLTKYDTKEVSDMSNSPLVSYTKLSPNHSGKRTHSIDRITPHCIVGQCSVETLGNIFAPTSQQASCQYGIGADGRVGMYVEEKNRSWCSSSNENDQRAVTIECASDTKHPYAFKAVVYDKLIELCVDICKRNGKSKLLWLWDKSKTLNYSQKADEMVLTVHRWFANKSCPGDWLYSRMGELAETVTKRLGGKVSTAPATQTATGDYEVGDIVDFTGSTHYTSSTATKGSACKAGKAKVTAVAKGAKHPYHLVRESGGTSTVYGWVNAEDVSGQSGGTSAKVPFKVKVSITDLNIRKGAGTNYGVVKTCPVGVYTIVEVKAEKGSDNGWGKLKSGVGWISLDFATEVK